MKIRYKFALGVSVCATLVFSVCVLAPASKTIDDTISRKISMSPQFKDGKFGANEDVMDTSLKNIAAVTWEFLFSGTNRTPKSALPVKSVDLSQFRNSDPNQLVVTWLGHSSLMVNIDGYRVLIDPVFEKRVSVLGPTRFNGEVPLNIDRLPEVDMVVISHDHYDHLNKFTIRHLKDRTGKFIVPLAVGTTIESWGVPRTKIVELDWWEEFRFDAGLTLAATPSQHFSGRGLSDRNKTLWASWVLMAPHHRIFFSGDSGYYNGFKQIGDKYGPFDMTFIECGAYNEKWAALHMFPEQTVQAHLDLKGRVLHPIHWGTFNLAMHPWYDPMQRLVKAAQSAEVKIATPVVGDTTQYATYIPSSSWWEPVKNKEKLAQRKNDSLKENER